KPFNGAELLARVRTHLELKHTQNKLISTNKKLALEVEERKQAEAKVKTLYQELLNDMKTAALVQSYLIPSGIRFLENFVFSSYYSPSSDVGGDLFDIIPLGNHRYILYIADISGHGIKAALLMTAVNSIIRMIVSVSEDGNPGAILEKLNYTIMGNLFSHTKHYMTILMGLLDMESKTFSYINAGHPPFIGYNHETNCTKIFLDEKGAIPIGWKKNFQYAKEPVQTIALDSETTYLLYTDGIFESFTKNAEELGIHGLASFIEKLNMNDSHFFIPQKIKKGLIDKDYNTSADDFTLMGFSMMEESLSRNSSTDNFRIIQFKPEIGRKQEYLQEGLQFIADKSEDAEKRALFEQLFRDSLKYTLERCRDISEEMMITFVLKSGKQSELHVFDYGQPWDSERLPDIPAEDIRSFQVRRWVNINETVISI
ncbi:MAG: SpoIIE family protein phosphatase, partial [Candidatus Cloacimonetes bacterium]|nr:SpoIIE family protein phosphatase [Candidatus Cloacimonadota bacterium]